MVSFNSIPEEDVDNFDDSAAEDVEIQLAYTISFLVENAYINEYEFLEAVDDIIKPSDISAETPYGKNIEFYSTCAPENFDIETMTFNFYIHFRVDRGWCFDTDRNNRINFFYSLKDMAISQISDHLMIGNIRVDICNIKLSNITYPEDGDSDCMDYELFE